MNDANVNATTIVYQRPAEVQERLAQLGIPPEVLREASIAGQSQRQSFTDNDAAIAKGIAGWNAPLRALRDLGYEYDWHRDRSEGLEVALRGDGRFAIAVCTGDDGTGDPDRVPRSKCPKGLYTKLAVHHNIQTLFDFAAAKRAEKQADVVATLTYVLLVHYSDDGVACELSLPKYVNDSGFIAAWAERILLPRLPQEERPLGETAADQTSPNVEVKRKAQ